MAGRQWRGIALAAGGALLLAACAEDDVAQPPTDEVRGASGEVLEGTISDAMIPLDQLRSQPPLMRVEPTSGSDDPAGQAAETAAAPDDVAVTGDATVPAETEDESAPAGR